MDKNEKCKKVYITTPIYYVNDVPHIGHAYTTMIADTLARYSRLSGLDTFFLTGTDEHGQKIEEAASARGKSPKEYADEISGKFRGIWDEFELSYDAFIRTTDDYHKNGVQSAFLKMFENGDIYKGEYEGYYCVSCETFFSKRQLIDDEMCPECGKATRLIKEESYFFALSKYQDKLLEHYENHPNFILPKFRKNEVVNFVKSGLNDLSITRTSFDWGVKLPSSFGDEKHVMYVWLDALLNYITALGYGGDEKNMGYWPAKIQLVGKDILRFHAIYWPAFLMSLGLPLPKHIGAHGWWTRNGEKMSKSKGNVINPKDVADAYGVENFRYFMLREVPFGQDGDFSQKALIDRINSDLSNDLGNLLNRVIGMAGKYFERKIASSKVRDFYKVELDETKKSIDSLPELIYEMQLHRYLEELWKPLTIANQAITKYEPWNLMKDGKSEEAMALVALVANILAKVAVMLHPVMPKTTQTIATSLGFEINTDSFKSLILEDMLLKDFEILPTPPLFPKIEEPKMASDTVTPKAEKAPEKKAEKVDESPKIGVEDFFKCDIRVGKILSSEPLKGSSKLLKLMVDLGEERPRQIIAGIKEFYSAESLVGEEVCILANLKPAKLMGEISEGMVLAAKDGSGLSLIAPKESRNVGSKIG